MPATQSVLTTQLFGWSIVAEPLQTWWPKLVNQLTSASSQARPLTIFTPNPEIVMAARRDQVFHQTIAQANYLIPDGIGLVWAARLLKSRGRLAGPLIAERIAGTDLVSQLLDLAVNRHWKVLIIGGRDYLTGTLPSSQPAQHLAEFPGEIWWLPGYQQISQSTGTEEANISAELERLKPAVVLAAFGAPHQEQWIMDHRPELQKLGVRLAMSVGGALDFLLGKVPRASQAWRNHGLEWLYRLIHQPWRWWRQLDLIRFSWLALFG